MKRTYAFILTVITIVLFTGCTDKETYVDLETGKTVTVTKDSTTGYMINADTKEPLGIYVNTATHDTIYGRTGKVINSFVIKHPDGKFSYRGDDEIKITDGDAKMKADADGASKVKDGDYKKKVDADGDIKIKDGDSKVKIDADGDKKVKSK
ncbi:MAG: hypothetical protein ABIN97_01130 [Ginsengibacter sp.]